MPSSRIAVSLLIALVVCLGCLSAVPTARAKSVSVVIEMRDFQFHPNEVRVDPGDIVTIHVFNNETTAGVPHTFDIDSLNVHIGSRAAPLFSGESGNATFTASSNGTFWFHCDIQGHATPSADGSWSGMAGRIIVGQAGTTPQDPTFYIILGVAASVAIALVAVYVIRKER